MFLELANQIWRELSGPQPAAGSTEAWPKPEKWVDAVDTVFRYRPVDLQQYLEQYWAVEPAAATLNYYWSDGLMRRSMAEPVRIGKPPKVTTSQEQDGYSRPAVPVVKDLGADQPRMPPDPRWKHLIYSYMIENTRIVEVFRRILHEIFHGETLGRPTPEVMNWAHLTERLVFSDRDGHWLNPPISEIRPDPSAIRRNAYYRLFGMDLSHGLPDGRPYPYFKPDAANREFVSTFEALLKEVWRAYTNRLNQTGVNPTDEAGMADLCKRLENMLRVRRHAGALSQHEFYCNAITSWFHLTVTADSKVVYWLQAQAHDEASRLRTIGEKVGLHAHTHSYEYFEIAEYLEEIVGRIERGDFSSAHSVKVLYNGAASDTHFTTSKMTTIINHWSTATGRNLKEYTGVPDLTRRPYGPPRSVTSLPASRMTVNATAVAPAGALVVPPR
jgi:hypothetical protein